MKKYLHILEQTSPSFTDQFIYMINSKLELSKYNTFYTHEKRILSLTDNQKNNNIYYSDDMVKVINEEYSNYDYIFIHAMNFGILELFKIEKEAKKKFIWLTWGHDLYGYDNNKIIMFLKQIKLRLRVALLKNIYAVGYGFEYDKKQIYKLLPNKVKTFHIPYGYEEGIEEFYNNYRENDDNNHYINVLIGHCGFKFINHIKIMKKIKKIYNKNIVLNLVLSYGGSKKYIEKVKKYAYNNFDKENINILDKRLNKKEYFDFLAHMDIAIFDYKHSSGLDNISALLYFGKKLYLNKKGVLYKGIDSYKNVPIFDIQSISKSYNNFSKLLSKEQKRECYEYAKTHISDKEILQLWKNFFDNN